jgi:hypothetical protein
MSDFTMLNRHRVRTGPFASTDDYGFNGCFQLWMNGNRINIITSDGEGWQHVSVSFFDQRTRTPSWELMCQVKDLFFEPEDTVIQFHPPHSQYVNNHSGCLHLWRCTDGREFPLPPSELVGIKGLKLV